MRPQDLIEKKRDGGKLSVDEVNEFITGVCGDGWADYQISAMLMAIFLRGVDSEEQSAFTRAMLHSGEVLDFSDIDKPKADKHSTGGVGDKTSLIVAPVVSSCGVAVPMISGRGLGHTGGTLDKLESIPGFDVNLTSDKFRSVLTACGYAMAGQTADIAPADKKLYALRDATATVPYIPLIVGSIMSKKLAEGLDALVLDVKTGPGAFMKSSKDSRMLAEALVATGDDFGVKTEALISDMSQPLGRFVGNSHEVYECIKLMRGETDEFSKPTLDLSLELSARMLLLSGAANDIDEARSKVLRSITSGQALDKFGENTELQGGNRSVCDDPESLINENLCRLEINAPSDGYISKFDAHTIGHCLVEIGGGRTKTDDLIDQAVGYECLAKIGDAVTRGQPLGVLYCRNNSQAEGLRQHLINAYDISASQQTAPKLVQDLIS
jgi:pyrimidine-nucleoside phosphorylase